MAISCDIVYPENPTKMEFDVDICSRWVSFPPTPLHLPIFQPWLPWQCSLRLCGKPLGAWPQGVGRHRGREKKPRGKQRKTSINLTGSDGLTKSRAAKRFNRWFLKHDMFFWFSTSGFLKTDSPTKCFAWWCWARRVPVDIVSISHSPY